MVLTHGGLDLVDGGNWVTAVVSMMKSVWKFSQHMDKTEFKLT
jgi:hypothetical protein